MAQRHPPGPPMTLGNMRKAQTVRRFEVTKPQRQAIVVVVLCVLAACLLLYGFWTHWF